ncbi:MAG: efflux RND transporter periplasmic adaptor subunit [Gammaproteobacteria bacterium]|jgi:hypothetical protein|nr:hypothetical protein [Nitrospinota bacterium]MDP6098488.1 efflux RND transporter periplasmic adaptor subunit [Gammaproteobacteria bacterium]|tara:strand:- start:24878 stop:26356 length:1479 start_codon:yes stop_codon:yes gene_type:complete
MLTFLTVIGLVLATAAIQVIPEFAGESMAMYIVEPAEDGGYGASLRDNPTPETDPYLSSTAPISSDDAPVLLAALTRVSPDTHLLSTNSEGNTARNRLVNPIQPKPKAVELSSALAGTNSEASANDTADLKNTKLLGGQDNALTENGHHLTRSMLQLVNEKPRLGDDGTIFLSVATQRTFQLRTILAEQVSVPVTSELPGHIISNPASSMLLQASYTGTVESVDGQFPFVGQRVQKGQLLARLHPINNHLDEAQVLERIEELTSHIDLARKQMAMLREVVYVRYRINKIEEIRTEIEGLIRRVSVLKDSLTKSYELRAKADGVISDISASVGQYVENGSNIFKIVDPTMLWVEAAGFEPGLKDRIESASAITVHGQAISLRYLGGGLLLSNRAIPLQFEIIGTTSNLAVNDPVTVIVQDRGKDVQGIKIPRSSIVRSTDGSQKMWERLSSERFVPHHVNTLPIDAQHVLVTSQLSPNIRVVTEGVAILDQIR